MSPCQFNGFCSRRVRSARARCAASWVDGAVPTAQVAAAGEQCHGIQALAGIRPQLPSPRPPAPASPLLALALLAALMTIAPFGAASRCTHRWACCRTVTRQARRAADGVHGTSAWKAGAGDGVGTPPPASAPLAARVPSDTTACLCRNAYTPCCGHARVLLHPRWHTSHCTLSPALGLQLHLPPALAAHAAAFPPTHPTAPRCAPPATPWT